MYGTGNDGEVLVTSWMFDNIEFHWCQPDPPVRAPVIWEKPYTLCVVDRLEYVTSEFFLARSDTCSAFRGVLSCNRLDLPYVITHPHGRIRLVRHTTSCDYALDGTRWTLVLYMVTASPNYRKRGGEGQCAEDEEEEQGGRKRGRDGS